MKLTYSERILNYLAKNDVVFNKSVARKRFKNVNDLHGTVMRTARRLENQGLLERVNPGDYMITKLGKQWINQ